VGAFSGCFRFSSHTNIAFPNSLTHSQIIICSIGVVHINLHLLFFLPGPCSQTLRSRNQNYINSSAPHLKSRPTQLVDVTILKVMMNNQGNVLQRTPKNNSLLKISGIHSVLSINANDYSDRQPDYGQSRFNSTINTLLPFLFPLPATDGLAFFIRFQRFILPLLNSHIANVGFSHKGGTRLME